MADKVLITGYAEIKINVSQLRSKEADKEKTRGPKQIGQKKSSVRVYFGHITQKELGERIASADNILKTGLDIKAKAQISKAKAEATRAKKKVADLEKEIKALKKEIKGSDK